MKTMALEGFANLYQGKKVLVTGHTGFKGSWLCLWLHQLGAEVYGYSLQPKTAQDNFVVSDVASLVHHKVGDLRDLPSLKAYVAKIQPDIVFHLAAQTLVLDSYKDPVETFSSNVMGTVNLLESIRETDSVRATVIVTTDKCYDNKEWVWGYRENDPMGGRDPYSASKGCAELVTNAYICSYFQDESEPCVASARAGNVIGGGDWGVDRIIPDYFKAYRQQQTLQVRNALSTRPWQHVLEPLSGYLTLVEHLWREGKEFQGGWNFGPEYDEPNSVGDLVAAFAAYDGKGKYEIVALDQPHEASLLKLDISKAASLLEWRPALSFDDTVSMTAEGYLQELKQSAVQASRLQQIRQYSDKAKMKGICWSLEKPCTSDFMWQPGVPDRTLAEGIE